MCYEEDKAGNSQMEGAEHSQNPKKFLFHNEGLDCAKQ